MAARKAVASNCRASLLSTCPPMVPNPARNTSHASAQLPELDAELSHGPWDNRPRAAPGKVTREGLLLTDIVVGHVAKRVLIRSRYLRNIASLPRSLVYANTPMLTLHISMTELRPLRHAGERFVSNAVDPGDCFDEFCAKQRDIGMGEGHNLTWVKGRIDFGS